MRKALTLTLLTTAFGALWIGFAQGASAGEAGAHVCNAKNSVTTAQCARVEVSPEVNVPELGVGDVVDDLTDTVTDLVGGLL